VFNLQKEEGTTEDRLPREERDLKRSALKRKRKEREANKKEWKKEEARKLVEPRFLKKIYLEIRSSIAPISRKKLELPRD
jgi:hypothetical protein